MVESVHDETNYFEVVSNYANDPNRSKMCNPSTGCIVVSETKTNTQYYPPEKVTQTSWVRRTAKREEYK